METIEIKKDTRYLVFSNGVRVKFVHHVGRLADGRLLVLEKDESDNVVGMELLTE